MISSPRSEPGDVVETAADVAAVDGRLALVAEEGPDLLLIVEADDEVAADRLEEFLLLDPAQDGDALGLPADLGVRSLVSRRRTPVEVGDALLDQVLLAASLPAFSS
jgi:hypothetical protein